MQTVPSAWIGHDDRQATRLTVANMVAFVLVLVSAVAIREFLVGSPSTLTTNGTSSRSWSEDVTATGVSLMMIVVTGVVWFLIMRWQLRNRGIVLSPAGIEFRRSWLNKRFIGWSEIRDLRVASRSLRRKVLVVSTWRDWTAPAPVGSSVLWGWFDDPHFFDKVTTIGDWRAAWTPPDHHSL